MYFKAGHMASIIEQSRVKAIRSVDHIRVRMYWELGFIDSFMYYSQLRRHCGRNSVGLITNYY